MRVDQIMTTAPLTCRPSDDLARVAQLMWEGDCGIIPVVDADGRVLSVVTDRDICIATATRNLAPSRIHADGLTTMWELITCRPEDDVRTALKLMNEHRVRRLPVTRADGVLVGIVSMNDIVREAGGARSEVPATQVVETYKSICAPHHLPVRLRSASRPAA